MTAPANRATSPTSTAADPVGRAPAVAASDAADGADRERDPFVDPVATHEARRVGHVWVGTAFVEQRRVGATYCRGCIDGPRGVGAVAAVGVADRADAWRAWLSTSPSTGAATRSSRSRVLDDVGRRWSCRPATTTQTASAAAARASESHTGRIGARVDDHVVVVVGHLGSSRCARRPPSISLGFDGTAPAVYTLSRCAVVDRDVVHDRLRRRRRAAGR